MILPFLSFLFDVKPVFSLRIVVVVGVVVKEDVADCEGFPFFLSSSARRVDLR
jgi:hypothetical protein